MPHCTGGLCFHVWSSPWLFGSHGQQWGSQLGLKGHHWSNLNGLLNTIRSPQFLVAFQATIMQSSCLFKRPEQTAAGSAQDVVLAYEEVKVMRDLLSGIRDNADQGYAQIYQKTQEMADTTDIQLTVPWWCGRQNRRNDIPGDTLKCTGGVLCSIPGWAPAKAGI